MKKKEELTFIERYILVKQKDKSTGNKEIARELGISRGEVKRARISLAEKLNLPKGN